ncbi:MAG: dTDP-4-dehydrorhamnose 3,5-epimerase [Bradyrhizobium sp.]|nr:dTDP-4-dehydrorhamnose 3,5-epimerase [Bradyrhizobium sp.]
MEFIALDLPGLLQILPSRFADERGYFSETFRDDRFRDRAGPYDFV